MIFVIGSLMLTHPLVIQQSHTPFCAHRLNRLHLPHDFCFDCPTHSLCCPLISLSLSLWL
uniref:Uncharacterized protein MANES_06G085100 n=1 Tax=Rhizophora mucronata TaxID=61149 RepID=A0A2P2KBC1_RHIMU